MTTPKLLVLLIGELTEGAGGDPWELQEQLLAGKPFQISELAEAFHDSGSHVGRADHAFDTARKHFQNAYTSGDHTDVIDDSKIVKDAKAVLNNSSSALRQVGVDLQEIAAALADAQNKVQDPIDLLNNSLLGLESEYRKFPWSPRNISQSAPNIPLEKMKEAATAVVGATHRLIADIIADYEAVLDARMNSLDATGYIPPIGLDDGIADSDPRAVHRWWQSLTPLEREMLIAEYPEVIGNLNGVPVADRSSANIMVMNADISRFEKLAKAKGVSIDEILEDPGKYGLTEDDLSRYHNASNIRAGLKAYGGRTEEGAYGPNVPTYLYVYEPLAFGGKGRAAIAIGNPDTAPNTAVLVPGASQSVRASDDSDGGWFATQSEQAMNLYTESNNADPDNPTAVVAWMGYDSPVDGLAAVAKGDPQTAREGGEYLARDVDGLWSTHQGPSHVTTVGYSAGAIVASDAAATSHLHTNDVVLLGPVSTDQAHNAADYHLDNGEVYVGNASNDLNARGGHTYLNLLGYARGEGGQVDPTDEDFGATRIKAETPPSYSSPLYYSVDAHLHYFTKGSESLYATSEVTSGNADRLVEADMVEHPFDEPSDDAEDNHFH
ncbi:putative alpha/beta hydrolase [Nocardia callitridis]|uniref:Alpha/beta hydrolase n=1 Tax=Nocardia callitridis TaxID=648753 RepID=A0ABP9KYC5_9NOCA